MDPPQAASNREAATSAESEGTKVAHGIQVTAVGHRAGVVSGGVEVRSVDCGLISRFHRMGEQRQRTKRAGQRFRQRRLVMKDTEYSMHRSLPGVAFDEALERVVTRP